MSSVPDRRGGAPPGADRYLIVGAGLLVLILAGLGVAILPYAGILLPSPSADATWPASRGAVAPDFSLPSLEGPRLRLAQFRGRVVVVNFWASWCPPCRAEMPSMETLYRDYASRGLVVLAIDTERVERSAIEAFRKAHGLTFAILLDPPGDVSTKYGLHGLPTTVVVDRQGKIASIRLGAQDWSGPATRKLVEGVLAGR